MFCYCLQRLLFLYLTRDITQNQCSKPCAKESKLHETLKKFQILKHEISMAVIFMVILLIIHNIIQNHEIGNETSDSNSILSHGVFQSGEFILL